MENPFETGGVGEESQAPKEVIKEKPVEISEQEFAERLERLKNMGRVIGRDFGLRVEIGKDRGWKYAFKPVHTIFADGADVRKKGLEYCFGLIAHEGAHARVSRIDFIPKDVWQAQGFAFLINAVEDPRVNNWVMGKYDGAHDWLEHVYNSDLSPDALGEEKSREQVGYVPKHIRFGLEIIRYWHTGKYSEDLPEDVKEALEKTREYAEMAYRRTPPADPSDEQIKQSAEEMYKIVYGGIWPEYQKLIEQSEDDEWLHQLIQELMDKGLMEEPEESESDSNPGESGESQTDNESGEESEGEGTDPKEAKQGKAKSGSKTGKGYKPLSEMTQEERKKLEERIEQALEEMTDEERKKLEQEAWAKAKKALEDLEQKIIEGMRGKFAEQTETASEERERKEKEAQEKEESRKRAEELRQAKAEAERKLEQSRDAYDRSLTDVRPHIQKVADDISDLLIHRRFPETRPAFPGQRMRMEGAMKWESRRYYGELFERRLPSERLSMRICLLVDLSGSMRGQKITETFKGAILFVESLEKVSAVGDIKVAIYGFQDQLIPYKGFDEPMSDSVRRRMAIMPGEVSDNGNHNKANYNNDGYCLDEASLILETQQESEQVLVVLSDGMPEGDNAHRVNRYQELSQDDELLAVVKDISQKNQKILGIGLGPGTEHVARFYTTELENVQNLPNVNLKSLAETLGSKLRQLFE